MNPLQILNFIQLAIHASPMVQKVYTEGKALAEALFADGMITQEQQNALMTWADAQQAKTLAGEVPAELRVDPN